MQARSCQVTSSPAVAAGRSTCLALPSRYWPTSRALVRPLHHGDHHTRYSAQLTSERHSICAEAGPPSSSCTGQQPSLAVFVSGGGSNFRAIEQACLHGEIRARVAVVVTNMPNCGGAAFARERGIPVLVYPDSKKVPGLSPEELVEKLRQEHEVDFVILAGYLKLIPSQLVRAYPRRMLNIHPGLLPAFGGPGLYGLRVHSAVVQSGARISGPTVHFVDEEYDTGINGTWWYIVVSLIEC